MVRTILFTLCLLLVSALPSSAGEVREIELGDGSVITGEVLSLSNGVYTIRSSAMGTITVAESQVRAIRSRGASSSAPSGQGADVRALQQQMMSDREVMAMIQSLKDDPQFVKALEDPEVMRAVSAGDVAALMANPKFLQLLQNPTVKDIQHKVAK